jgi:hypothetical protein
MSNKIKFTKVNPEISDDYAPIPAKNILPEWYKKTPSYINGLSKINYGEKVSSNGTIKKCIPVFDALTAGYILTTPCDIVIRKTPNGTMEYYPTLSNMIHFHDIIQAPYHPNMNKLPYPKIENPWAIQTPPGYSCLIMPPVHSTNTYFTILEGVVDTDKFFVSINFPFVLNDTNFEGVIPAGTPMAQIIPFKRETWQLELGNHKDIDKINKNLSKLKTKVYDRYKTMFWSRKDFS